MKLAQFQNLIIEMPVNHHAFTIKKTNWRCNFQMDLIDQIFSGNETISISRYDLMSSKYMLPEFVIKTLMWGYPTKGRGNNIESALEPENFDILLKCLEKYRASDIPFDQFLADFRSKGINLSTFSKFITFLDASIDGYPAQILDLRIIDVINSNRFEEFSALRPLAYHNAPAKYKAYLYALTEQSRVLGVSAAQIEMFLFTFGKNLSPIKGEDCYDKEFAELRMSAPSLP